MKFLQRLGRSLMLPVAVLPVAAIFSGVGYWITTATGNPNNVVGAFLGAAGGALLNNMPLLFALGVAIGMAKKSDGTSALSGLASWLVVTTLLSPETMALLRGIEEEAVPAAFGKVENVFVGIICGLIGAWSYDKFKDTKLPDALAFFSGKRSVAIVSAAISVVAALILMFVWPIVFAGLVAFGELMLGMGPIGTGLFGFFNRLLIPLGLHHALNSVFWFDVAGINDLPNYLSGEGTKGTTGQYMTGFFPIMMFGLPGAALAMYTTAKTNQRKLAAALLLSGAISSILVGVTEPLEFAFMFLAPVLYVVHALFTGISMAVMQLLPIRAGFGFSAGFIDLLLGSQSPMAENPWMVVPIGLFWFVVYFLVFRWMILRFDLKTPGRDDAWEGGEGGAEGSEIRKDFLATAAAFIPALGGQRNILEIENCATRLRMELEDPSAVDEAALKRAGAAGVMKPGGKSVQVIYGLNVQFVKDAMEAIMSGEAEAPADAAVAEPARSAAVVGGAAGSSSADASSPSGSTGRVLRLRRPLEGRVVPLSEVPDPTFSGEVMGPGAAVDPEGDEVDVVAPAAGRVSHIFDTGHAVALTLESGADVLIHVGLDTVEMKGHGFRSLVAVGDEVLEGQPLLRVDLAAVRAAGHPTITPVVVLNDPSARIEM